MAGISLRQLPDRTPVKLTLNLMPDLTRASANMPLSIASNMAAKNPSPT